MSIDPYSWNLERPGLFAIGAEKPDSDYLFDVLKKGPVARYNGQEKSFESLFTELTGGDLFSSAPLLLISHAESYSDKELMQLLAFVKSFDPSSGVRALFAFTTLQKAKVKALFEAFPERINYLKERPWDRTGRLRAELLRFLKEKGLSMSPEALGYFDALGLDPLLRLRELEKLVAFCGDRKEITLSDIEAVSISGSGASSWKALDYLLENKEKALSDLIVSQASDTSSLLGLIFPLRHQIAQSSALLENRADYLNKKYPYLSGSRLQKARAKLKGTSIEMLDTLYGKLIDFEVFVKSSHLDIKEMRSLLMLLLRGESWTAA